MGEWFGPEQLLASIRVASAEHPGSFAFYAKNLTTGEEAGYRADAVMPTASVIKVGIMAELYRQVERGDVELDRRLTVTADDWYGGTGVLKEFGPGIAPTVADLCRMMIVVSDNVATGMLVRLLGKERINQTFADWDLPQTELLMNMRLGGDIRAYAVSTPREIARLLELIATDGFLAPSSTAAMRDHLARQQHLEQMGRYLPFNPYAAEIGMEQPLRLMNKIGNYMGMRAEAAIVEAPGVTFVVAAMNEGSPDRHFRVDHEGNILNGRIARAAFDAWVPSGSIPEGW